MVLTGGVCFGWMYLAAGSALPFWAQWPLTAAFITALEFCVGAAVNVWLGWAVWDYSGERFNLYGQICPRYALLWFALSLPGLTLARLLRSVLLGL